ncbi:MAG: GntR family transcriptional regulator [Phycisphaerae bacterium]
MTTDATRFNRSTRGRVADWLRAKLAVGEFEAGDRLTEQPLAARLGIGRGPIRDALIELTKEGLLVAKPHCGVRVAPAFTPESTRLLVQLRKQIEVFALQAGFDTIDAGVRESLRRHLVHFRVVCEAGELADVVQEDMHLHRIIVRLVEDGRLETVWLPIIARMRLPYSRHKTLMESYAEHERIVEAVLAGDLPAATAALQANIRTR